MRKVLALMIAVVMCMAMSLTAYAADITIDKSDNDKAQHKYEAYQIFTGVVNEHNQLTEIEWGDNADEDLGSALATAFASSDSITTKIKTPGDTPVYYTLGEVFAAAAEVNTAAAYAEAIGFITSEEDLETLTDAINDNVTGNAIEGNNNGVQDLDPGYYLVKDEDDSLEGKKDGAYTKFILRMLNENINVDEKAEVPTVEKEVQDEEEDAEEDADGGYGKSADHEINETFNFRVTATIPADVNIANYDTYKVVFHDTMSEGVTYEEIVSVNISGMSEALATTDYTLAAPDENAYGGTLTITIDNLKDFVEFNDDGDQADDIEIVVVYKAHLNEKALVRNESGDTVVDNYNDVYLEYSNNADAYGDGETGETPKDTVFVFTYDANYTKYADKIEDGKELPDAGFTLYDSTNAAVQLVWDDTLSAYRPAGENDDSDDIVTEMFSQDDGTFNIVGLDAGTYTLKETTVPTGYNPCDDIEVTIESEHVRNATKEDCTVTLEEENTDYDIVDLSGTVLPSTGGIGTTIFYVVGAMLVVVAGILLVTRRRMSAN